MKKVSISVQEYIKSGEYFIDARNWYNTKYLSPITQRSYILIFFIIFLTVFTAFAININALFPIIMPVRYSLPSKNPLQSSANIIDAGTIQKDPAIAIAEILIKDYIIHREEYDYEKVDQRNTFIQNNSTRLVYRKFYNYMNIDNPDSPKLRYQSYVRRSIEVTSLIYPAEGEAIARFNSIAKTASGEVMENMIWETQINFEIDKINRKLPNGSRFNFTVTNYKLKLLENKYNK